MIFIHLTAPSKIEGAIKNIGSRSKYKKLFRKAQSIAFYFENEREKRNN
jgi:hypothetical protein